MSSEERKLEIKKMIVDRLNLKITPESISNEANLFGSSDDPDSVGLDSVDALELAVGLMNEFQVEISDENMEVFQSVNTINEYVENYDTAEQNNTYLV